MLQFLLFANQYQLALRAPLNRGPSVEFVNLGIKLEEAI